MAREKNGWIKLYSSVLEKDFTLVEFKIWVGLLLIANTAKSKTPGLIDLSLREVANRLNVSTGALVQAKEKFIAQDRIKEVKLPRKTRPIMAIEIINFSQYQGKKFVSRNEQSRGEIVSPSEQIVHPIEQSVSPREQSRIQNRPPENSREYTEKVATTTEKELLKILESLPGWQYKEENDLAWLRELMVDFQNVAPAHLKGCRDYYSDRPTTKGHWKTRIRNWMRKEAEFREKESPERKSKFDDGWPVR